MGYPTVRFWEGELVELGLSSALVMTSFRLGDIILHFLLIASTHTLHAVKSFPKFGYI